jgi:GNAT superfamily N-acetyltransferase
MRFKIDHYAGIENTPALQIALRGQLECAEAGGAQEVGLHFSYNAILASADGEPVGVIVWYEQKEQHRLWLQLGYVKPEWRGCSIYTVLWRELIAKAVELKLSSIWSGTAASNLTMRAIAKRQGRSETAVLLKFDVPAEVAS